MSPASTQCLAAIGKMRHQISGKDSTPYVIGFACQLIMAVVMAAIMPGQFGARTPLNGLLTEGLMWLGFVITAMTMNHRHEGAPRHHFSSSNPGLSSRWWRRRGCANVLATVCGRAGESGAWTCLSTGWR